MPMSLPVSPPALLLTLVTALGYAVATVGMKLASSGAVTFGVFLATIGFTVAFLSEILLMQRFDLSYLYIVIIVAESALVLLYAVCIGEGLSPRQLLGAAMVLLGLWAVSA
ncbi:5-aminolevulinate synthase [Alloyangia pacifica]|uniref:5-aminolevulinate synthase n=1 Tax=Alloyangia pacifica TaxID=311180 RepID=A0A1I6VPX7_9RHOB|nr:5-aminolevulinate synthase [Alloyangia pacifica]SDI08957.1 hypothetical protein SAMN04488245_112104 [Alloyangia pacifica]SFT15782.1 hypothetical protein SAMN04488050_112104 [Alloyangia pacifica]